MSDVSKNELRRLDFMLLLVLTEGVRRRKLSDVAVRLGVTQTAISHSVAKLRDLFDDELFIRRPHGVEPTARALRLAETAEGVLEGATALLRDPTPFDPGTTDRRLRVAALDFEVSLLAPTIERVGRSAPGLALHFRGADRETAIQALERGEADLWLGFARNLPTTLETRVLFEEGYSVIARSGHPAVPTSAEPLDLDAYCDAAHVVAAPGGTVGGIVDETLRRAGRTRRVAVMTTGFLSALDLVARTDMIATVPSRLAQAHAGTFGLWVRDPPIAPRPFRVSATWHRRAASDPVVGWFVEALRADLASPSGPGLK